MSNKNVFLAGCSIILVLAELIAAIIYYVKLENTQSFVQSKGAVFYSYSLLASSALAVCVDTAIALSVVVLLRRHRSEVFSRRTSSMVDRIIIYTVGSGLLTAAFAFVGFILVLTLKPNFSASFLILEMLPKRELSLENGVRTFTDHSHLYSLS